MENHNTCMVGHELDRCDRAHNPGDVVTVYVLTRHHGEKYPGAAVIWGPISERRWHNTPHDVKECLRLVRPTFTRSSERLKLWDRKLHGF